MTGVELLLSRLERVKRSGSGWTARCPAHDDHSPSLSVAEGDEGRPVFHCHAGCSNDDILAAVDLTWAELLADQESGRNGSEPEAVYGYVDVVGEPLFEVVRFPGKRFAQRRLDPSEPGGYAWRIAGVKRVLYRADRLFEAREFEVTDPVYFVEGEKDVHAVERAGALATTNPGGAGKWRAQYAGQLAGLNVVVVADRDDTGRAHARQVAASLEGVAASLRLLEPVEGKDVSDHLAAGHTLEELVEAEPEFELPTASTDTFEIRVYSAPELASMELPASADPLVGPFLRRGMATLIGGLTGHGKTTWIAQAVKAAAAGGDFLGEQVEGGSRVLVLDLEQHLHSIQRVIREAGLDECDTVDYAPIPEGLALGKRDDQLAALEAVFAAKPYDVVVCDPFYKLHEADSSDELVARLLVALLRGWINEYGFAILTATHCRKLPAGRVVIGPDDLFGSSLFTRDPEVVLGIQRHASGVTKLHVFKSREPGLDFGQVFELLFSRERGFWLKPTVDPEEREAELARIGTEAIAFVTEHPNSSTRAVQRALSYGADRVKEALLAQVQSGLLPEPLKGSRNSLRWFPLNHPGLTAPEPLPGAVSADAGKANPEATAPERPDCYVVGGASAGAVDEAQGAEALRDDEPSDPATSDVGPPDAAREMGEP